MAEHTPAPWQIHPRSHTTITAGDRTVASAGGYSTNMDNGEHLTENAANARLIAAAPDLYQACHTARAYIEADLLGAAVVTLDRAIDKANGGREAAEPMTTVIDTIVDAVHDFEEYGLHAKECDCTYCNGIARLNEAVRKATGQQ